MNENNTNNENNINDIDNDTIDVIQALQSLKDSTELLVQSLEECKTSLESKGVSLTENPKASQLPALINSIEQSGGSGESDCFTIVITYDVGQRSDIWTTPDVKLASLDASLNYEPTSSKQWEDGFGDGDGFSAYVDYTFKIPEQDITDFVIFEFLDLDENEKLIEYLEIRNDGFWIKYEPDYRLIDTSNEEIVGYLSKNKRAKSFKLPKDDYRYAVYSVNIYTNEMSRVSNTNSFTLGDGSQGAMYLVTATSPNIALNGYYLNVT